MGDRRVAPNRRLAPGQAQCNELEQNHERELDQKVVNISVRYVEIEAEQIGHTKCVTQNGKVEQGLSSAGKQVRTQSFKDCFVLSLSLGFDDHYCGRGDCLQIGSS